VIYEVAVLGVLLASLVVKHTSEHLDYFRADKAWFYIVLLTIGYLGSRDLAKSRGRDHYDGPHTARASWAGNSAAHALSLRTSRS
jgi:hypothetical protein